MNRRRNPAAGVGTECGYHSTKHRCSIAPLLSSSARIARCGDSSPRALARSAAPRSTSPPAAKGFECAGAAHVISSSSTCACPTDTRPTWSGQLRAVQPDLRVLYLIGRRARSSTGAPASAARMRFLTKPFGLRELTDVVESWLDDALAPFNVSGLPLN